MWAVLHHANVETDRKVREALGRLSPEPGPQVGVKPVKDTRKMTPDARRQVRQGDVVNIAGLKCTFSGKLKPVTQRSVNVG